MFERICEILEEFSEIPKEDMKLESDILNDLGMNSIDIMEVVVALEGEFEIEVPDRLISSFKTLGDIVEFIEKR